MAIDWSKVLGGQVGGAGPGSSQADEIMQALAQMTPEQQRQYVAQLQNLTAQQKQQLLAQLQQTGQPQGGAQGGQAPQTAPAATPFTPPAQGTPLSGLPSVGGQPLGPQTFAPTPLPSFIQPHDPNSPYTPAPATQQGQPQLPGATSFPNMTQDEQWNYATQALGYDSKAAYQAYVNGARAAIENGAGERAYTDVQSDQAKWSVKPPNQWLQETITASEGQFAPVIDFYATYFANETGGTMDAATRQQLMQAVQGADPEARATIQAAAIALQTPQPPPTAAQQTQINNAIKAINAAGSDPTKLQAAQQQYQNAINAYQSTSTSNPYGAWVAANQAAQTTLANYIGTGGFLYNMFTTAVQTAPNMEAQAQQQSILKAFQAVGMTPTPAAYTALAKATPDEVQQYILTQPLPSDPKVPYGVYQAVKNTVDPLYLQYFGSMPTQDQLMGYMGMNQDQIMNHIMGSPSKQLPGATVGRFNQLKSFADSMVPSIGYGVSDQVIAAAHTGMQKP